MRLAIVSLFAALLATTAYAADVEGAHKTANPMKIGIIGAGEIGGALARHWAAAGHQLLISSRHPEQLQALAKELGPNVKVGTPREAAAFGDVVMLAVPYGATPQVGRDYAAELKGKVVLDAGNPYPSRDGEMAVRDRAAGHRGGVGGIPAWHAAGARVQRHQFGTARARGVPQTRKARHSAGGRRSGSHENRRATRPRRGLRSGARRRTRARPGFRLRHTRSTFAA